MKSNTKVLLAFCAGGLVFNATTAFSNISLLKLSLELLIKSLQLRTVKNKSDWLNCRTFSTARICNGCRIALKLIIKQKSTQVLR